jgi:outer membrane receptor protein involved in Fe transport
VVTGAVLPLPLLSKKSYNLIGFYEKYGLSMRLAFNHRDGNYIGQENGLNQYTDGYDQLDFNMSYQVTDNFNVFGGVTNITESAVHNYLNIRQATRDFRNTGRRWTFGLSGKF